MRASMPEPLPVHPPPHSTPPAQKKRISKEGRQRNNGHKGRLEEFGFATLREEEEQQQRG